MNRIPRRAGFTYVELMMVLSIIAVLAAIAVPNFLEAQVRASVSRSKADLSVMKLAIESYRLETRGYPRNRTPGVANPYDLTVLTTPVAYLTSLPNDIFTTQEARGSRHPDPMMPVPYQYFNGLQVDSEAGLKIDPAGGFARPGLAVGLIWGIGPGTSRSRPYPGMTPLPPPTSITAAGKAMITPYDPTNGSTSRGDIYLSLP